jgi:hypothetical protein
MIVDLGCILKLMFRGIRRYDLNINPKKIYDFALKYRFTNEPPDIQLLTWKCNPLSTKLGYINQLVLQLSQANQDCEAERFKNVGLFGQTLQTTKHRARDDMTLAQAALW